MSTLVPFPAKDGGYVFECTSCHYTVHTAEHDGYPVCLTCRWFDERPQIPREVRDRILPPVTRDSNGENGCGNG